MARKLNLQLLGMILILVGMLASAAARAERTGSIAGCLTDAQTGLPVIGAWVAILENNMGAVTDSTGCFAIENLPTGKYTLSVTHRDYGTIQGLTSLTAVVDAGRVERVQLNISLRQAEELKAGKPESAADKVDYDRIKEIVGYESGENRSYELPSPAAPGPERAAQGSSVGPGEHSSSLGKVKRAPDAGAFEPRWDRPQPEPRDMYFRDYGTNEFIDTRRDRFSTFALDVDDASYALAREYLRQGHPVPSDAVRVEEFINHFDYGYNVPGREKFRVFTELTDSPFDYDVKVMKIAVKSREIDRRERLPFNITFVIDKSGSMNQDNRFGLVRESVRTLVRQLNGGDRVGIVAYGSSAFVALEQVSADRQRDILSTMDNLYPGGSTFAEAGIQLGYEMANRQFREGYNNIVILCSDGVANVGKTSPDAIMREIEDYARRGISLNAYGYGMGNYNDVLLEQLAQKGNGQYAYVNDSREVNELFGNKIVERLQVLARDVKVQVEFDPKVVKSYRLLGYENRAVPDYQFRDNRKDGGELFAGHEVTAVYELVMQNQKRSGGKVADVFVRWKEADESEVSELKSEVNLGRDFQAFGQSRPELRLAIVAGRFAEMLKGTRYAASTSWTELYNLSDLLVRELPGEQTEELRDLIRSAGNLDDWHAQDQWQEKQRPYGNYKR
jgi:Ca-activated chloride channel family protein